MTVADKSHKIASRFFRLCVSLVSIRVQLKGGKSGHLNCFVLLSVHVNQSVSLLLTFLLLVFFFFLHPGHYFFILLLLCIFTVTLQSIYLQDEAKNKVHTSALKVKFAGLSFFLLAPTAAAVDRSMPRLHSLPCQLFSLFSELSRRFSLPELSLVSLLPFPGEIMCCHCGRCCREGENETKCSSHTLTATNKQWKLITIAGILSKLCLTDSFVCHPVDWLFSHRESVSQWRDVESTGKLSSPHTRESKWGRELHPRQIDWSFWMAFSASLRSLASHLVSHSLNDSLLLQTCSTVRDDCWHKNSHPSMDECYCCLCQLTQLVHQSSRAAFFSNFV